jgi:hypothetical protein
MYNIGFRNRKFKVLIIMNDAFMKFGKITMNVGEILLIFLFFLALVSMSLKIITLKL